MEVGEVSELCEVGLVVGDNIVVIDGGLGGLVKDLSDGERGWFGVDVSDGGGA